MLLTIRTQQRLRVISSFSASVDRLRVSIPAALRLLQNCTGSEIFVLDPRAAGRSAACSPHVSTTELFLNIWCELFPDWSEIRSGRGCCRLAEMKGREQFKGTADREEAKDIKTHKGVIIRERRPNVERVEQMRRGRGASRSGRGLQSGRIYRFKLSFMQTLTELGFSLPPSWIMTASISLVSSVRSEDSKEVFLAIQVDGVTRARTAPLALRGPALSLNHAFHLQLERAQLLRVVMLTPGKPSDCAADEGSSPGETLLFFLLQQLRGSALLCLAEYSAV